MAQNVTVYVCDTAVQAQTASDLLEGRGATVVLMEAADNVLYDAILFDGGVHDSHQNKFIVIGRVP